MAEAGKYEGLVELRSRLPDVSDTVITYFLSKYGNVEECYEKLKNGQEENSDNLAEFDSSFFNSSQSFDPRNTLPTTNAQVPGQLWTAPSQDPRNQYPSHPDEPSSPLPYPNDSDKRMPASPRDSRYSYPESELILDQRHQVAYIHREKENRTRVVNNLRVEVDQMRQQLTKLRIDVTDCPTKMDITALQDIISTLEDDILTFKNKVGVQQQQLEMKQNLDMYTEEGVRWNCQSCKFLNHPLMSRCESCDNNR